MSTHGRVVTLAGFLLGLSLLGAGIPAPVDTRMDLPPSYLAPVQRLKIIAAGDIMMHMPVVNAAAVKEGGHLFSPIFSEIAPLLREADIAIANLETTFAKDGDYKGYPRFKSPGKLARDLKEVGFDLLVTANNHALDYGEAGVLNTLADLDRAGVRAVGTQRDAETQQYVVVEKDGIRVGVVAYTCLTNGFVLPKGKEYLLNLFSRDRVGRDVLRMREAGADLIVCYIHFGDEYQRHPSPFQREVVGFLHQAGVDVIFGSHPHVVQPAAFSEAESKYVIYSLGNFLSNQRSDYKDVGLLAEVSLAKFNGATVIEKVRHIPTYVSKERREGRMVYRIKTVESLDEHLTQAYCRPVESCGLSFYGTFMAHVEKKSTGPLVARSVGEAKPSY